MDSFYNGLSYLLLQLSQLEGVYKHIHYARFNIAVLIRTPCQDWDFGWNPWSRFSSTPVSSSAIMGVRSVQVLMNPLPTCNDTLLLLFSCHQWDKSNKRINKDGTITMQHSNRTHLPIGRKLAVIPDFSGITPWLQQPTGSKSLCKGQLLVSWL